MYETHLVEKIKLILYFSFFNDIKQMDIYKILVLRTFNFFFLSPPKYTLSRINVCF